MVFGNIDFLTPYRQGTFLSYKSKVNNEKDNKLWNGWNNLPLNNVKISCWFHLKIDKKRSSTKNESKLSS